MDFCTIISDSRAQQFPWKFIATHALRELYFFLIKMTLDFLVWCYCRFMILLVLSFVLQLSPWWCPSTAVAMTCYGLQSACKHAALPVRLLLLQVHNLDECAALLYCLVLWQACGQGKADSELYFWSIVGTCVYAMWTQMIDLIWMFFAKQLFISGYEGLLWCL